MHDLFSREPDPLDGMLAPPSLSVDADALRQQLYAQTSGVLRRRRRLRQSAYTAALAASFAAGVLATWLMLPTRSEDRGAPSTAASVNHEDPPPSAPTPPAALAAEWRAVDSDGQRRALYQQAGDVYMTEEHDPLSALRCYGQALDNGTEADLAISADDNWLLMAIKNARQKETDHAKNGG